VNGFAISPVGLVFSPVEFPVPPETFRDIESEIRIFPQLMPAIEGLEEERSILVLFRFHLSSGYSFRVHPRGDISRPLKGVFATCSPHRPNQLGLSHVALLGISGNSIMVKGLDALNGTPVIDIKPFRHMDEAFKVHTKENKGEVS
jgi:tRNA-Thr(GGU) m(6)t(6)A37 methyltransferase TsaA